MNEQIDESIPVLTEIIATPDGSPVTNKTKTAEAHFPLSTPVIATANIANKPISAAIAAAKEVLAQPALFEAEIFETVIEEQKTASISEQDWAELEQTVRENVLRQVLSRVDFVLEHRVSDSLAEVLQTAVDRLADEIRAGLRHSMEEVVTRAVTQELNKIKGSNRNS
ncbi:hypothetical protein [Undibacterium sp.]|uniref:hypothetical protein n=1 Tax=Undibacterium sp. TaxID=1914977 RepID=UPI003751D7F8